MPRTVVVDTNVFDQINRSNHEVTRALKRPKILRD